MLALINNLIAMVLQVLSILGLLQEQSKHYAQETNPLAIELNVVDIDGLANHANYGFIGLWNKLTNVEDVLAIVLDDLAAIPTNPQLSDQPVILPTTPPAGYGAPSSSDNASAVWDYVDPREHRLTGDQLSELHSQMVNVNLAGNVVIAGTDNRSGVYGNWWDLLGPNFGDFALPEESTILPTDTTPLVWLDREQAGYGWFLDNDRFAKRWVYHGAPPFQSAWEHICLYSPNDWRELLNRLFHTDTAAPIWPGLSNVTLGTPVPLAPGLTVMGPLHGVIVNITAVPDRFGNFAYDDLAAYKSVGAVTFVDDNGDAEEFRYLGFVHEVYCPRTMAVASAAKVRCGVGIVGTVTPFTIP